jgi:hypothetical protein
MISRWISLYFLQYMCTVCCGISFSLLILEL